MIFQVSGNYCFLSSVWYVSIKRRFPRSFPNVFKIRIRCFQARGRARKKVSANYTVVRWFVIRKSFLECDRVLGKSCVFLTAFLWLSFYYFTSDSTGLEPPPWALQEHQDSPRRKGDMSSSLTVTKWKKNNIDVGRQGPFTFISICDEEMWLSLLWLSNILWQKAEFSDYSIIIHSREKKLSKTLQEK